MIFDILPNDMIINIGDYLSFVDKLRLLSSSSKFRICLEYYEHLGISKCDNILRKHIINYTFPTMIYNTLIHPTCLHLKSKKEDNKTNQLL